MKNYIVFLLTFFLLVPPTYAMFPFSDTTKLSTKNYGKNGRSWLWLRQPTTIITNRSNTITGVFEIDGKGFYFLPNKASKHPFIITYGYLFKDIFIEWKEIAKIKRRGAILGGLGIIKDMLFIKTKDGRKYFFVSYHSKKAIIKEYKKYMGIIEK